MLQLKVTGAIHSAMLCFHGHRFHHPAYYVLYTTCQAEVAKTIMVTRLVMAITAMMTTTMMMMVLVVQMMVVTMMFGIYSGQVL